MNTLIVLSEEEINNFERSPICTTEETKVYFNQNNIVNSNSISLKGALEMKIAWFLMDMSCYQAFNK